MSRQCQLLPEASSVYAVPVGMLWPHRCVTVAHCTTDSVKVVGVSAEKVNDCPAANPACVYALAVTVCAAMPNVLAALPSARMSTLEKISLIWKFSFAAPVPLHQKVIRSV